MINSKENTVFGFGLEDLKWVAKVEAEGQLIYQRAKDGYVNATAMCHAGNKKINDYNRLEVTKAFLVELSGSTNSYRL